MLKTVPYGGLEKRFDPGGCHVATLFAMTKKDCRAYGSQ